MRLLNKFLAITALAFVSILPAQAKTDGTADAVALLYMASVTDPVAFQTRILPSQQLRGAARRVSIERCLKAVARGGTRVATGAGSAAWARDLLTALKTRSWLNTASGRIAQIQANSSAATCKASRFNTIG